MGELADALFSKTQQQLLGLIFAQPDRSFYTKEILRNTGMGVAHVRRELASMESAGILTMRKIGNQHHYQANVACPIYPELQGVVKKTVGMVDVICATLAPIAERITWSFIFGSIASGKESVNSDIDLMVIGEAEFNEVVALLFPLQEKLGREINPKVYPIDEWQHLDASNSAFVKRVLNNPRIDVLGNENELRKFGGQKPERN